MEQETLHQLRATRVRSDVQGTPSDPIKGVHVGARALDQIARRCHVATQRGDRERRRALMPLHVDERRACDETHTCK